MMTERYPHLERTLRQFFSLHGYGESNWFKSKVLQLVRPGHGRAATYCGHFE